MMKEIERKDLVKAIREKGKSLQAEMSFFDHIDVLRMHLIRSSIAIILFTCIAFIYYDFIFTEIVLGPKRTDFWTYRMMCLLSKEFHLGADLCIKDIPFNLINTDMAGQFTLQMNSSFLIGVILGFPYLLFELWNFIKPALHEKERKAASGFTFYATALFLLGILFGYYIIAPLSINFLANFRISEMIQNQITLSSYLSTVATLSLGTGVIFELPILIYILSKLRVITSKWMRLSRRYATVTILIVAAVVTPTPDILTMLTVSFPMFLLYELSILIANKVEKRRQKAEEAFFNNN